MEEKRGMAMRRLGGMGRKNIDSLSLMWCVKKESGFFCGYERREKRMVFCGILFQWL